MARAARDVSVRITDTEQIMLTHKENLFAQYMAVHNRPSYCYIKAGYSVTENREATANNALKLRMRPVVKSAIDHYRQLLCESLDVSAERIVAEIALIAMSNIHNVLDDDGRPYKNLLDMDIATQRAVKSFEFKTYRTKDGGEVDEVKIMMHAKVPALKMLADYKQVGKKSEDNRPVEVTVNIK